MKHYQMWKTNLGNIIVEYSLPPPLDNPFDNTEEPDEEDYEYWDDEE